MASQRAQGDSCSDSILFPSSPSTEVRVQMWRWRNASAVSQLYVTALFSTRMSSLLSVGRVVSCDADIRRFQKGSLPPEFGKYRCQC
ncbi:hypothetical protein GIB67_035047 [Kingdonia uniflora]|uniref:Uncharacterized protein n=1 Tax=Kingdonia uniflora TaxID=39325 RepID=A0A7J7L1P0_9MAGN|nr:hypothetical protein GIB67_035047 [Kingdonia uniflora]